MVMMFGLAEQGMSEGLMRSNFWPGVVGYRCGTFGD